ncbi:MAG TPA: nicotinate-nucleotide adenylyltransferase [Solirubrobacteraceae bacterium]|nr:nicotinate-nucleotide adenylyltransferase [Solirubrobacteraceae bacterium]
MRVGILGGTFNPPHLGHLICAQEAYLQLGLDCVMLIPARTPPHKPVEDEPGAEHRYELCRSAVDGDPRFEVSDVEIRRAGTSFTVDTLEELNSRTPDNELFLIVGGDVAAGLPSWHRPERVLELARLAVAKRRGTARERVERALESLPGGDRAAYFRMPRIGISSTMIRRRVRAREPITYLTPDPVASYIDRHQLYRGRQA